MDRHDDRSVDQLLREHDLLSLFRDLTLAARLRRVVRGLRAPPESGEHKYARLQIQRLSAPVLAIVVPIAIVLLITCLDRPDEPADRIVTTSILDPTPAPRPEPAEPERAPPVIAPVAWPDVLPAAPALTAGPDAGRAEAPAPTREAMREPLAPVRYARSPVTMNRILTNRGPGARERAVEESGGNPAAEGAVLRALRWLKQNQEPDGHWSQTSGSPAGGQGGSAPAAMTSLALLAYLARDETAESEEFGETVRKAIAWLLANQGADGSWRRHYEHQIAVYALTEAYAMTRNPLLKEPAERGLDIIVRGQNPAGGWNYPLAPSERNDTSVMAWCAQALKAGRIANLDNSGLDDCIRRAVAGFRGNAAPTGGFGYTGPGAGGLTGAGCLSMQLLGAASARETLLGVQWIAKHRAGFDWPQATWKDLYYWYYDTQVRFQTGGREWKQWNETFLRQLAAVQTVMRGGGADGRDIGFWPAGGRAEGNGEQGVMFGTVLCTLTLEVYYRYLPTYKPVEVPEPQAGVGASVGPGDIGIDIRL